MGEMTDMGELHFTKGHGTENDFVLVADLDGTCDMTPDQVRRVSDRRAGIGGDGHVFEGTTFAAALQAAFDGGGGDGGTGSGAGAVIGGVVGGVVLAHEMRSECFGEIRFEQA